MCMLMKQRVHRCIFQGLLYTFLAVMHLMGCLCPSDLFALSLCLLMRLGRAGMSMDRGIIRVLKDFRATVRRGLLCVLRGWRVLWLWKAWCGDWCRGTIQALWPQSPCPCCAYSLTEVYSNLMVKEEGGGWLPVLSVCGRSLRNLGMYNCYLAWQTDLIALCYSHTAAVSASCS